MTDNPKSKIENLKLSDSAECVGESGSGHQVILDPGSRSGTSFRLPIFD